MAEVKINESRLKELERAFSKLQALENGGVDNWEWYGESLKDWRKENELEELFENTYEELLEILAEAHVEEPAGRGCGYSITPDEKAVHNLLKRFTISYSELEND